MGGGAGTKTKPSPLPWAALLPGSWGLALGRGASLCGAPGGVRVGGACGVRGGVGEGRAQTDAPEAGYTYHSFLEMKDPSF